MKLFCKISFVMFILLSIAGVSMAQGQFVGVKSGLMMLDVEEFDDIIPIGLVYGHSLDRILPNLWVEGEFNYGLAGGEYDTSMFGANVESSVDIWTAAVYAAYRYPVTDRAYLKGKIGLLYESVEIEATASAYNYYDDEYYSASGSESDSEFGLSVGIGGGFNINERMAVEAEYTMIESDVNYLSIGFNYSF